MFGSECITLPPDYSKSVMHLLTDKSGLSPKTAQVSEGCLASWV